MQLVAPLTPAQVAAQAQTATAKAAAAKAAAAKVAAAQAAAAQKAARARAAAQGQRVAPQVLPTPPKLRGWLPWVLGGAALLILRR